MPTRPMGQTAPPPSPMSKPKGASPTSNPAPTTTGPAAAGAPSVTRGPSSSIPGSKPRGSR
jgi:hypothetical protein